MSNRKHFDNSLKAIYSSSQLDFIWRSISEDVFSLGAFSEANSRREYIDKIIPRLKASEPIQYITEKAYFYDRIFYVNNHVLIPRSETEILVDKAIKCIKKNNSILKVLDIGTGSGCIPVAIKSHCPRIEMTSVDISNEALVVARRNANRYHLSIQFKQLNFLEEQCWDKLTPPDVIISNPPYIDKSERDVMASSTLRYEPAEALYADDPDPLIFYKKIHEYASGLAQYPVIFLELNEFRSAETAAIFEERDTSIIEDLEGRDRVLVVI